MSAVFHVGDYILVSVTDTMCQYMIVESDPIWTLLVSYFMQKYTYDSGTTSNDGGRIGNTLNLTQLSLLLALQYKRESVFEVEATWP